jgi:hypothetical protein
MTPYYCYIFVRQDITPEQQLIQFGHVAAKAGAKSPDKLWEYVHFVGIGVRNERELHKAALLMADNDIPYSTFNEGAMDDELTAVASVPVRGPTREVFKNYKTLRFGN